MKIHILSDLHVEFEDFLPPATDADVVVLAGDIGVGTQGLEWAALRYPGSEVIYVPGNHEFYHQDIRLIEELKGRTRANIHVLNDDQTIIDGVRFLGSVLWSDFELFGLENMALSMQMARRSMPDFSIVQNGAERFTPEHARRLHLASRRWLETKLSQGFAGETVVVTHHAPSNGSVAPRFAQDLLTPAFASNLHQLMGGDRVKLWIHGHMHDSFDYRINGTRVICNPRGYAPEAVNPGFRPNLVVEV